MQVSRFPGDLKYILMNSWITNIPVWTIRKLFFRAMGLHIGRNSHIGIGTKILWPKQIYIGERTIVNEYCHLDGRGGLTIGDDCSISIYSKIITASHHMSSSGFKYFSEPVKVDNNVWIGTGAIILNGSHISKGAVIGAGAVFKGDAEPFMVYGGNPAKEIHPRKLNADYQLWYEPFFR